MYKTIIFDLGGVLFNWNPKFLYDQIFDSSEQVEHFLKEICNQEWNEKQDAGRPFKLAVAEKAKQYPEYQSQIEAYDQRWVEMLAGPIEPTLQVFWDLVELRKKTNLQLLALSNWSAEKFIHVSGKYDFLVQFDGITVSGTIGKIKPNKDIFEHHFKVFSVEPKSTIFIDDNEANIKTASELGLKALHFQSTGALRSDLQALGFMI